MGNKHHILTQKELDAYQLDYRIQKQIDQYVERNKDLKKKDICILDWGCGRGRAVLNLLNQGFNAYGVDVDTTVIKKGYPLFEKYGYPPEQHLFPVSNLENYPRKFFHFIFSEQVFEHIARIESVIQMHAKLLVAGGIGCHVFPSSKMIKESHVHMPFVHWLPKNQLRKIWISLMMILSKKPDVEWPETTDASFWKEVKIYYDYLHYRTFYRDNRALKHLFEGLGFKAKFFIPGIDSSKRKFLPDFLLKNGFPDQQVCFVVQKQKDPFISH